MSNSKVKRSSVYANWVFLALVLLPLAGRADLVIELDQVGVKPTPIAVVPFAFDGAALPLDMAGVIAADLKRSGRFAPLAQADMLAKPTRGSAINFSDWRRVNTEVVVVGELSTLGEDSYALQFQVFDVYGGRQILGYRLPSTKRGLRLAAHRAADMIYEELTGIPGIFSTRIAYVTANGRPGSEVYEIIVADADGENQYRIAESRGYPLMSPSWSPDGRQLAYVSFEGGQSSIVVQTVRTGSTRKVSAREGINGAPSWSPDGRKLAITLSGREGNPDIYVLTLADNSLRRLTTSKSIETEASWSPDGQFVYFTSDRAGAPQIYRLPLTGGKAPERITYEGRYNARPRLSPDGEKIAVVHDDRGNFRIAVHDLDNRDVQVLTEGGLDESPAFAPNGETLIYATRSGGRGVLATVSVDGAIRQRLAATDGDVREPVFSPFRR